MPISEKNFYTQTTSHTLMPRTFENWVFLFKNLYKNQVKWLLRETTPWICWNHFYRKKLLSLGVKGLKECYIGI